MLLCLRGEHSGALGAVLYRFALGLRRCAPCVLEQCLDDSLTNVVPKDQLTSYKLGGATECHAPELAVELRDAKAEVGACTRAALVDMSSSKAEQALSPIGMTLRG